MAPVIIVTGASRGMGAAMAKMLLSRSANLVLVARTEEGLKQLAAEYPGQVEYVTGDVSTEEVNKAAVSTAVEKFGSLDGIIFNAAILDPIATVAKANADLWRKLFDINYFSLVLALKEAIPHLRKSKGRVVFISSGASHHYFYGWGAYGGSKAATDHLCATLAGEEPEITAFSLDPGVMDTDMQKALRETHGSEMKTTEHERFLNLKADGDLSPPEKPGNVAVNLVLKADPELSGKTMRFNAAELAPYRDFEL
ncbi:hypothetical protein V1511DRAFT_495010 [Dipodascopsis uninucleata]